MKKKNIPKKTKGVQKRGVLSHDGLFFSLINHTLINITTFCLTTLVHSSFTIFVTYVTIITSPCGLYYPHKQFQLCNIKFETNFGGINDGSN